MSVKVCGHNNCMLSISTCCACSDTRPNAPGYPIYIDGVGHSMTGTRSHDYCPACKDGPTSKQGKECGHNACVLTTQTCCSCSDRRPYAPAYKVYIDGVGYSLTGKRDQDYCPTCKGQTPAVDDMTPTRIRGPRRAYHDLESSATALLGSGSKSTGYDAMKTTARSYKDCGHDSCHLTIPTCCACMDKRPFMKAYPMHVDGMGLVMTGSRHEHYCPGCKFGLPVSQFTTAPPSPASTISSSLRRALHGIIDKTFDGASSMAASVSDCLPRGRFGKGKAAQTDEFMVENACIMCYEKHREVVFEPCHHMVICEACADMLRQEAQLEDDEPRCPICRKEIDYYFQVFRP